MVEVANANSRDPCNMQTNKRSSSTTTTYRCCMLAHTTETSQATQMTTRHFVRRVKSVKFLGSFWQTYKFLGFLATFHPLSNVDYVAPHL